MDRVMGVMFDMDNTILASRIDYAGMKAAAHRYLAERGVLPAALDLSAHTTGTLIAEAMATGRMREDWIRGVWDVVTDREMAGMRDAKLEPGATELLEALSGTVLLAVVTNNSRAAAEEALGRNGILHRFDCVVAREDMAALKPSPDGFLKVLERYPHIPKEAWIAVGDSWIDGKAASAAGIRFVACRSDLDGLKRKGVSPAAALADLRDLPAVVRFSR